jgi:lipopolysaccharide export system permease protein
MLRLLLYVVLPAVALGAAVVWFPMPTRDRYILRKFAGLFLLSFLLEVALVLIVRLGDRELGNLVDAQQSLADGLRLFLYRAPERVLEVIPASGILAAFFTIGSLTRSNELVALRATGVNLYRLVVPVAAFAVACSLLTLLFVDRIVAPSTHRARLLDAKAKYAAERDIIFRQASGGLCYIQSLDLPQRIAHHVVFYDFDGDDLRQETFAAYATWDQGMWRLHRGWVRRYEPSGVAFRPYEDADRPLTEDPSILVASANDPAEMTFAQLRRVIHFKRTVGVTARAEVVRLHHNVAYSFALLVGVLLSLPLSMQFGRFAVAVGFPATMFLSFVYWGMAIATFEAMGENGRLAPVVAAWMANFVFGGLAVVLFRGVRR